LTNRKKSSASIIFRVTPWTCTARHWSQHGKEVSKNKKVVLGLKSQLRKHEAEEKLREIIRLHNGRKLADRAVLPPDDSVTFDWLVKEKYLPCSRSIRPFANRNHELGDGLRAVPNCGFSVTGAPGRFAPHEDLSVSGK
jgi:hypothetical protein